MGDILLATPSLRAVRAAFPGIEIDFVVGGGMTDALTGHNNDVRDRSGRLTSAASTRGFDHFAAVPRKAGPAALRFDHVNLHPSAKSYLMAAASGAKTRLTFVKHMEVQPRHRARRSCRG